MPIETRSYMNTVHNSQRLYENFKRFAPSNADTVVGLGLSGVIAVTKLGEQFGLNTLAVRKENDGSHARNWGEGDLGKRWVFVDDLMSSGATFRRAYTAVSGILEEHNETSEFLGAYFYESGGFRRASDFLNITMKVDSELQERRERIKREQEELRRQYVTEWRIDFPKAAGHPRFERLINEFLAGYGSAYVMRNAMIDLESDLQKMEPAF